MAYVTPRQLAIGSGALLELSQLFEVAEDLLTATIEDGDRSAWQPAEIATADAALVVIVQACEQATSECDTRLVARGYAVPMSPEQFPVLVVWARSIARYHLNRNRDKTDEERGRIERDYRDALRSLDMVTKGTLSLGAGDPLAASGAADVVSVTSQPRIFSRDSLGRL